MGGKKKNKEEKVVEAVFYISMHCNACERSVAKVISKIKGVEKFTTDMTNHKVMVVGKLNPKKVLKKLKKKTGKRVELLVIEEQGNDEKRDLSIIEYDNENHFIASWLVDYYKDDEIHHIFNDENANACSIM